MKDDRAKQAKKPSQPKRYYWLKIKGSFFNQLEIKKMRKLKSGETLVIAYLKMMLLSLPDDGYLIYQGIGETIEEEISDMIDEDEDHVRSVIEYGTARKLIKVAAGDLYMTRFPEMVGSESFSAERTRRYRAKKKAQLTMASQQRHIVQTGDEENRDRDRDRDRDREELVEVIDGTQSLDESGSETPFVNLPLKDKTGFVVTRGYIEQLSALYPKVDIEQEIRKMLGWLDSEPARRKTRGGIKRFITSWLARAQDQMASQPQPTQGARQGVRQSRDDNVGNFSQREYSEDDYSKFYVDIMGEGL